jgi:hypothetical protein
MARPVGSKSKNTLIREQALRARQAAARIVDVGGDPYLLTDCLSIMEEAMRFFYRMAREAKENVEKGGHYVTAANLAKNVAPFRFPQLSTVKVGGEKGNPLLVREGVTAQQVREELLADIAATGLLPTQLLNMTDVTPGGLLDKPSGVMPKSNGSNGKKQN